MHCAVHRRRRLAERALFRANGGAPECLTSGGQGPARGLKKVNPPGAVWSKPINIACGTSGDDEPAVLDFPDRLRAVRRAGSVGSSEPDVPRALGSLRDALLPA